MSLAPSLHILCRGADVVGYAENGRPFVLGFSQAIHAHLAAKRIGAHPSLQMYRSGVVNPLRMEYAPPSPNYTMADTEAMLFVHPGQDTTVIWDVTSIEYKKLLDMFHKVGAHVLLPYEYMGETEKKGDIFRCQILDLTL